MRKDASNIRKSSYSDNPITLTSATLMRRRADGSVLRKAGDPRPRRSLPCRRFVTARQNLREQGSLLQKAGGPDPVGACPAGDPSRSSKTFASKARGYESRKPAFNRQTSKPANHHHSSQHPTPDNRR